MQFTMNKILKSISVVAGVLLAGAALQSCALDEPFVSEGDGTLQMKLVINSDVTRAENDPADLSANCVVYISGAKGLLHKYVGLENVPEQISLKTGHYVAEAWTGDSVDASFDKKFFRGYQPFDMAAGINQVVVNCKIANVVASVNASSVDAVGLKDFDIKVENTRGSLNFTPDNYKLDKGYFMMPGGDTSLKVTVTGSNLEGKPFTVSHLIENVERAHEYVIGFVSNPEYDEQGGAFISIVVDDSEVLVESEVEIFSRPALTGVGYDASKQIMGNAGGFSQKLLKVNAFGGINKMIVSSADFAAFGLPEQTIDLKNCTPEVAEAVRNAGLSWDESFSNERNLAISFLTFSRTMLNRLPERDEEYRLSVDVTDKYGKSTSQTLRFAVGEGAVIIDDPVTIEDAVDPSNLMAVTATRATLTGSIVNADATNPGINIREAGTSEWTFCPASQETVLKARRRNLSPSQAVRSGGTKFTVTISNLKPGVRYEYKAVADGFESESKFLTTESKFIIPNASMEEWGTYSASTLLGTKSVNFPGTNRNDYFWDSGNEGAATANKIVLNKSTDMVASGTYSARLSSTSAMSVIAAGNMFAGRYVKTDGTDGILSMGREFNGSHPTKLRVYANYRPGGSVSIKSGMANYVDVVSGGTDHGQIYIALTTAPIEIRTKASERKLFPAKATNEDGNPSEDFDKVVAYGQVTWDKAFGPDGQLQVLDIPFVYNERAKTQKPLYIVITASASKFGDFYCGSASSVMYLDNFELIYE